MQTTSYNPSHVKWLFAVLVFVLFFHLGSAPIYILDEAKNAQCAREMLQRNDWVVPTFNGELRTDKPVLHYYFMMLAYKIFGVNEFAARFFSALLGCLTVAVTFLFTKRFTNVVTGFCAALALATSSQFLFEFRLSVPDPYLIFFITVGLLTAYTYLEEKKFIYLLIAALSFGLATLAKGPVALALPGLCLLTWVIIRKKWQLVLTWKLIPALILIAAVTLPWYLAVHKATNGAWTRGFFIEHNINRFSDPQEGHGGIFLITLAFVIIGLLPFTTFIGEITKYRKAVFDEAFVKFSGIVVIAFVVFFSISSTKLPNYPMPCYPFAAIIIGHYLSNLANSQLASKTYPLYILIGFTLILPIGGYFAIGAEKEASSINTISLLLIIAPLALLAVFFLWKRISNYKRITGIAIAYTILNILLLHIVYPILYSQNPVKKTIVEVQKHSLVYAYKSYNPGYNFYLNSNIPVFTNADSLNLAMQNNKQAIVISRKDYEEELKALNLKMIAEHHDLFESPTTVLYVAQP